MTDVPDGGPGMLASMTPEPPGRSLVGAEFLQPERDGQIRVLLTCDCGAATDLTVIIEGCAARMSGEAAFTCPCGTSHWFTVTAKGCGDG